MIGACGKCRCLAIVVLVVLVPHFTLQWTLSESRHGKLYRNAGLSGALDTKHLHHLVAEVVDHLHGDAAGLRFVERPDVSLFSVAQASSLISALRVVFSAL